MSSIIRYEFVNLVSDDDGIYDYDKFSHLELLRKKCDANIVVHLNDYSFNISVPCYLWTTESDDIDNSFVNGFSCYPSLHFAVGVNSDDDMINYLLSESLFGDKKYLYSSMVAGCSTAIEYFKYGPNDSDDDFCKMFCNYIINLFGKK